jgi:hypothetical protein
VRAGAGGRRPGPNWVGWPGALILLAAMLALRGWDFGNPVIHVDEQYYLLVGDRMLKGAAPYLDIWDRKPIGLFLLYAAMRLLPGDGVLAYQLCAAVVAWATALLVRAAARQIGASDVGALSAALAYLLGLELLGGRGGQAPVFYNLPMAAAGLMTLRLPELVAREARREIVLSGVTACLLAGIAIQLKYTPAMEGLFFGLAHCWALRRTGVRWPAVAAAAALWGSVGLLPTLMAIAWYAHHGAFPAFWFANVTSIGLRPGYPVGQLAMRLLGIAAILSPLAAAAALDWSRRTPAAVLGRGWLAAAAIGFFAIGTFFDHYALPLLPPLTTLAGPALGRLPRLRTGTLGLALALFAIERVTLPRDAAGARAVAALAKANSRGGCPYVFIGDTATYELAGTCLPTAYAFPNLLAYATERGATGIDEAAEVRRILAARPPIIVTSDRRLSIWNGASLRAVKAALRAHYRLVFTTPRSGWHTAVYLRRDLPLRR